MDEQRQSLLSYLHYKAVTDKSKENIEIFLPTTQKLPKPLKQPNEHCKFSIQFYWDTVACVRITLSFRSGFYRETRMLNRHIASASK
jgi:hypothetical protein